MAGGYDGVWLDQEHGGLSIEQLQLASACARANSLGVFVRMAPESYARVSQNLEAGMDGVMAARVKTASEVEEFVRWCKFAPRGNRGFNNSGFDAQYTRKPVDQFIQNANRDLFVAIQIETVEALEEVDQIAAVDGVDLLFFGPGDMAQALGYPGQFEHEEVWDTARRVSAACRKQGKNWGTVPVGPEFAARSVEMGCRMLTMGSDARVLSLGIDAVKDAYGAFF